MTRRVTLLAVVSLLLVSVSAGCSAAFWEGFAEGYAGAGGASFAGGASSDGVAQTDCPEGTWPRNLYSGPGGGMYTGPGGGLYTGPGSYCSNRPPLPVFLRYLEENGYEDEAALIRRALR